MKSRGMRLRRSIRVREGTLSSEEEAKQQHHALGVEANVAPLLGQLNDWRSVNC